MTTMLFATSSFKWNMAAHEIPSAETPRRIGKRYTVGTGFSKGSLVGIPKGQPKNHQKPGEIPKLILDFI